MNDLDGDASSRAAAIFSGLEPGAGGSNRVFHASDGDRWGCCIYQLCRIVKDGHHLPIHVPQPSRQYHLRNFSFVIYASESGKHTEVVCHE